MFENYKPTDNKYFSNVDLINRIWGFCSDCCYRKEDYCRNEDCKFSEVFKKCKFVFPKEREKVKDEEL